MNEHRYFSFDGDTIDTHATEAEARTRALEAIDHASEEAADYSWPEEVESYMWGEIRERAKSYNRMEHAEGCTRSEDDDLDCEVCQVSTDIDYCISYRLARPSEPADPKGAESP